MVKTAVCYEAEDGTWQPIDLKALRSWLNRKEKKIARAKIPALAPSAPKVKTPLQMLWDDWWDTYIADHKIRFPGATDKEHTDPAPGITINRVLQKALNLYGFKMADDLISEYWVWYRGMPEVKKGRKIEDFENKMAMLRDIILERAGKRRKF